MDKFTRIVVLFFLTIVCWIALANGAQLPKMQSNGNPLIGKIWSVKDQQFVTPEKMTESLVEYAYILLGEIHDNPTHHLLQAWILQNVTGDGDSALVMEMIRSEQDEALQKYLSSPLPNAKGFGPAIQWEKSGWPKWEYYQPIVEVALKKHMSIFTASPSKENTRKIARLGKTSIPQNELVQLALDKPLGNDLDAALNEEIKTSHCDLLPENMIPAMAFVQRYRDGQFARAMVRAGQAPNVSKVVLIAGNGHVRNDRAVPWYLTRQNSAAVSASVIMLEVDSKTISREELITPGADAKPVADYYWFTQKAEREDQCEKLRKRFKK